MHHEFHKIYNKAMTCKHDLELIMSQCTGTVSKTNCTPENFG